LTAWLRARPLPPLADVWLTELARLLPELLAQRPDLAPPGPLSESWQRQRLFEALARAFVKGNQPLVLLIDDLHWCDRDTLEWLHYLLRFDPAARMLVIGTVRSDVLATDNRLAPLLEALRRTGQLTEIELGPLSQAESFALAVHLAGRDIDPALAGPLYQGSEGNPLFLVEMVQAGLAKEGPWSAEHGQRMAYASLPLPPKVRMVIETRLAQLSPPARELAEVAATIGREFTFPVLLQASGGDEDAVVRRLDELWRRRIVREQGQDAYDFGHDKIREVAYSALSSARRRLLHRRVAEALESTHAQDLDAVSGQIATHYEQAGQPRQAVEWYGRAADAAQRLLAHEAAADYSRRALALLESEALAGSPEEWRQEASARLSKGLADALAQSGEHEKPKKTHKTSSSAGKDEA
ncbi:MAG: AAA family ATPase, partial [Anaerolineales bacterium]